METDFAVSNDARNVMYISYFVDGTLVTRSAWAVPASSKLILTIRCGTGFFCLTYSSQHIPFLRRGRVNGHQDEHVKGQ